MKLSAPTKPIFLVSLVLFILALLGKFAVAALAPYVLWLALAAWIVIAIGCLLKGL
ncbi:MAG: hypothetical protein AAF733_04580 [Verrucomicrobiota bacterium]